MKKEEKIDCISLDKEYFAEFDSGLNHGSIRPNHTGIQGAFVATSSFKQAGLEREGENGDCENSPLQ